MTSLRARSCAVVVAAALAACGRGDRAPDTASSAGAVSDSAPAAAVAGAIRTASAASVGTYLTDANGRSLYMFESDTKNVSTCTDACAKAWPPFPAAAQDGADALVRTAMLSSISRSDNGRQATYSGMPLYYYEDDKAPGDIKGQGKLEFGGLWYVVSPSGQKIVTR